MWTQHPRFVARQHRSQTCQISTCPALHTLTLQADTVELSKMSEALKPHLSPPEPVTLRYTIRPDGPPTAHPDCYDFEVEVPLRWGWGGGECGGNSCRGVRKLSADCIEGLRQAFEQVLLRLMTTLVHCEPRHRPSLSPLPSCPLPPLPAARSCRRTRSRLGRARRLTSTTQRWPPSWPAWPSIGGAAPCCWRLRRAPWTLSMPWLRRR